MSAVLSEPAAPPVVRVYRLIKGPHPAREDFLSDKARHKRLRERSAETVAHHEGLSAWRSLARIHELVRRFPMLGTHIAELELPPGTQLLPFSEDPEHLTVFEDPDVLLRFVVRVMPLD
ncbi:MAG: hypothetical protein HYU87_09940 [Chloroflexi bacterium]|nr:hypothetical protein [Chloroflexota bacterium]